jgi:hypothetical protein
MLVHVGTVLYGTFGDTPVPCTGRGSY